MPGKILAGYFIKRDRAEELAIVRRLLGEIDRLIAEGDLQGSQERFRQLEEILNKSPTQRSGVRRILR